MADYYPRAELKFMDGGHNVGLVDSREQFIDYVSAFLNNENWCDIFICGEKR